jgi:regulator of protease activity HflC (stomatin/prohibitin superfamily)
VNGERTAPVVQGSNSMSVDDQTRALLDLVETERKRKCDAILADARGRSAVILQQAHADARKRMRESFVEERLRRDVRIGAAQANLQTRRRLADQQRAAALLSAGRTRLPDELLRRWQAPDARRVWVAAVVGDARKSLPAGPWRIAHAPDWPAAERIAGRAEFAAVPATECVFDPDPRIRAGLKISARGCIVDGTLDGLLSDRAEIGSRLLQLLNEDTSA